MVKDMKNLIAMDEFIEEAKKQGEEKNLKWEYVLMNMIHFSLGHLVFADFRKLFEELNIDKKQWEKKFNKLCDSWYMDKKLVEEKWRQL